MKIKAVLRRGPFTSWIRIEEGMPEIHQLMPSKMAFGPVLKQSNPTEYRTEVWVFREGRYLAEDIVEYEFDRIERR